MKKTMEEAIIKDGEKGQTSLIRSSVLINMIHEVVKKDLVDNDIDPTLLRPPLNDTKPEMKVAGFLKKKDQDVCVVPGDIKPKRRRIDWGPGQFEDLYDEYGEEYIESTLIINVRSQLSSIGKNTDTLFERTFAEPLNLRMVYDDVVLGEVYLIAVYEYDDQAMKSKEVRFDTKPTDLKKYISFFSSISGRLDLDTDTFKYERCALIIVDFSTNPPTLYHSTKELIDAGLLPSDYSLEYADISYDNFIQDVLKVYKSRFGRHHIFRGTEYIDRMN
jgi:hypothetical protein